MTETTTKETSGAGQTVDPGAMVDEHRLATGKPKKRRMRADDIVAKHATAIRMLHADGRPKEDALLFIELQEGELSHKQGTMCKAINVIIPDWRKPAADMSTNKSDPKIADVVAVNGPFHDDRTAGGQKW